jgi:quercetin 2,3-dioxygenase
MGQTLYAGSQRFVTRGPDRSTHHSFSFGEHYDPANLGFGPMLAHNDDHLDPGGGYPDHPHTDLEIVTWVLSGALVHTDSAGRRAVVEPGQVQVLGAGSGIVHSEVGDAASGPTRFVQVWVRPDEPGLAPRHVVADAGVVRDLLVPVVGGSGPSVRRAGARLLVGRLRAGAVVALPDAPLVHVFAATGAMRVGHLVLSAGDALRVVDEPGLPVHGEADGELLVWAFG